MQLHLQMHQACSTLFGAKSVTFTTSAKILIFDMLLMDAYFIVLSNQTSYRFLTSSTLKQELPDPFQQSMGMTKARAATTKIRQNVMMQLLACHGDYVRPD